MPSHSGMSLGRGIQGTNLPPTSYPPPPPPRPLPNPQVTLPRHPSPPSVTLGRGFLSLPLCGACPIVGYCGLFSINYLRKKNDFRCVFFCESGLLENERTYTSPEQGKPA